MSQTGPVRFRPLRIQLTHHLHRLPHHRDTHRHQLRPPRSRDNRNRPVVLSVEFPPPLPRPQGKREVICRLKNGTAKGHKNVAYRS